MKTLDQLRIATVQPDLYWEDRPSNRSHLQNLIIKSMPNPVDLIILPEMFTTGFTMNAETNAEPAKGETLLWMRSLASELDAALCGSIIVREKDRYYNRLYFVRPSGDFETYDKRHTFSYVGEDQFFESGVDRLIVQYRGWKLCPLICYDLRFPVWSRNTEAFDALIYVANWPASRTRAWDTLLPARAIENLCYTIGANRVGRDDNDILYLGRSVILDPLGECIAQLEDGAEGLVTETLEKKELGKIRNKFRFLDDRDAFVLKS